MKKRAEGFWKTWWWSSVPPSPAGAEPDGGYAVIGWRATAASEAAPVARLHAQLRLRVSEGES